MCIQYYGLHKLYVRIDFLTAIHDSWCNEKPLRSNVSSKHKRGGSTVVQGVCAVAHAYTQAGEVEIMWGLQVSYVVVSLLR